MSRFSVFTSRLRAWLFKKRLEQELDAEIRFHLEMQADDNVRAGMDPRQAAHAASRSFGGVTSMKETYRERRTIHPFETIAQDLRYAWRMMLKNPGFTAVAVVSLAIGIGANCATFSAADALLLRPLPVPHPSEVLTVGSATMVEGFGVMVSSYPDYLDIRDRSKTFDGLVAFTSSTVGFATQPDALPALRMGMLVSGNFFSVMGVEPQLGRAFRPEESQVPGRDAVLILGHDFWEHEFGADRSILGRTVRLNGIEFTIVGVAPPEFTGMDQFARFEFYAPLMMWPRLVADPALRPLDARGFRNLTIKGRLKAGVTRQAAQTELSVIAIDLEQAYPETNRNRRLAVRTEFQTRIAQSPEDTSLLAMITLLAAAVLLVACGNVAGLLTSRAPVRAREVALRLAIGAGRARIVRQLVTESMLIAVLGGGVGLGVGYVGVLWGRQFRIPTDLPIATSFELDRRALLVSLVVALVSAFLFGLAPAIRTTRTDLTAVIKSTDAAGFGRRRRWGRALLVGGQVAGSVLLLAVATFVYRGFQQRLIAGPGHRTDHLLLMSFNPSLVRYSDAQAQQFFEQIADRARLVPGVKSAALASSVPMDGARPVTIAPEGFQFPEGKESTTVPGAIVDEYYFDTMGLSILEGRGFRSTDSVDAPKVAVVNEVLAQHYWPGQDPVGQRFRLDGKDGAWVEVVGLAKTSKYMFIMEPPREFVYLPYKQRPQQRMTLLTESMGDPSSLVTPLREMVRSLDANQPIFNVRTMEEFYRMRTVITLKVVSGFITAMGLMGLILAIVGLYGLVAYTVSQRTREIGIRMAIGANRSTVLRMVLGKGMMLAVAGLGLGLLASMGASRGLSAVFPGGPGGDGRTDFVAFPLVAVTVLAVTVLAAYLPARRASLINPTEALRNE
jgi:putative ABC transport system permease protein